MEYRSLGRTKLQVSVLGIGSWQLSGPVQVGGKADGFPDIGSQDAIHLIRSCQDLGINLIDTAEIYGDGEGERRIGQAIQAHRNHWIISSKFGLRVDQRGRRVSDCSPKTIRHSLDGSLKRLNTNYIDIYLYHCPPKRDHILEGREVLSQLKKEGKIRFFGISTDESTSIEQLITHKSLDVVLTGRSLIQSPQKILKLVQHHRLGLMIRGAFAGGLLSGQYFHQLPSFSQEDFRYGLNMRWGQYTAFEKLCPTGMPMSVFALRYLLDQDTTQTIILGSKTLDQYHDAIKALSLPPLEANTHQAIQRIRKWHRVKNLPRRALRKLGYPLAY